MVNKETLGPNPEIEMTVNRHVATAKEIAINHSSGTQDAKDRINNAIERRFRPYVTESEVIAAQLSTRRYQEFLKELREFLGVRTGVVACPDGRIVALALIDPRVGSMQRKLQGLPDVRFSTEDWNYTLNDPDLAANIRTDMRRRAKEKKRPHLVEFVGPHIHSFQPEHGCGACIGKIVKRGLTKELGMKNGGIDEYFDELGEGFYAFDNLTNKNGGSGTTFDMVHDAYSQGLIFGVRNEYQNFDSGITLRENLLTLGRQGKIVMTELLDDRFPILETAEKMGLPYPIDVDSYEEIAKNAIAVGKIAQELTTQYGISWLPKVFRENSGASDENLRVLSYYAIRNTVYRVIGDINVGKHILERHPEKLIRVGPIGADFNVKNIPFIQSTAEEKVHDKDIQETLALYDLAYDVLGAQGVDLRTEGRIIFTTGSFDAKDFSGPDAKEAHLDRAESDVKNNAAHIRLKIKDAVARGEAVVFGGIYEPGPKKLIKVV